MLSIFQLLFLIISFTKLAIAAGNDRNNTNSATFVFKSPSTDQSFVFALNAVEATGDLYLHLEAPAGQAWAAVGLGSEMEDALIFAAYPSDNGTGVTVSPRIAKGHAEPSFTEDIDLELLRPSGFNSSNTVGRDGRLRADAVCRNCTSWLSGRKQFDLSSTSYPFIFAVGPSQVMKSSSQTASMRRHDFYGHFTMDMRAATSKDNGTVPAPNNANGTYTLADASEAKEMTGDNSSAPAAHALIMLGSFIFLFPLGSLLLRVIHKALWHAAVQTLALLCILIGFGIGIYLSTLYNKSNSLASAHQIIGLLIVIALLFQFALGLLHHRTWKQTKSPTTFSKIHKYLGPVVFLFGLVNGGLGFNFAGNSSYNSRYVVVILTVAVLYSGVLGLKWWWSGRKERKMKKQQQQQQWVGDGGYHGDAFGPPDSYGHAVPLKTFQGGP